MAEIEKKEKLIAENLWDIPQREGKKALLSGKPFPVPVPVSVEEAIPVINASRNEVLKGNEASLKGHLNLGLFGSQNRTVTPTPSSISPTVSLENETKQSPEAPTNKQRRL